MSATDSSDSSIRNEFVLSISEFLGSNPPALTNPGNSSANSAGPTGNNGFAQSTPIDFKAGKSGKKIDGTPQSDNLKGTDDNDTFNAKGLNDKVNSGKGNDILRGQQRPTEANRATIP